jgi:serine phosphatase RsbU (regulator of sigma subunit)
MLEKLDRNVKRTLNRENENSREGMEIALCLVNFEEKRIYFSGAKLSAIIFTDDGEMQELKPTRKAINDRRKNDETDFELQIVEARYKAEIFLMSDGLKDQFNAEKRKFSKQKITELLQKNHHLPMSVICAVFEKELHEWRGNEQEQLDDITLFGLRLHF